MAKHPANTSHMKKSLKRIKGKPAKGKSKRVRVPAYAGKRG